MRNERGKGGGQIIDANYVYYAKYVCKLCIRFDVN